MKILRVEATPQDSPDRAALTHVLIDTIAALTGRTPSSLRRQIERSHGTLTVAVCIQGGSK